MRHQCSRTGCQVTIPIFRLTENGCNWCFFVLCVIFFLSVFILDVFAEFFTWSYRCTYSHRYIRYVILLDLDGKVWKRIYESLARAIYLMRLKVMHNKHPAVVHKHLMSFVEQIKAACRTGRFRYRPSMHLLKHVYGNFTDIGPTHCFSTLRYLCLGFYFRCLVR